ncbi:MAG TPA: carboxymuconolactone decarboxylase family protein [Devosiaceae bacterium]
MSEANWPEFIAQLNRRTSVLRKGAPEVMAGFSALATAAGKDGALSPKIKELIALAISITARCDGCLAYHAKAAHRVGATREEVIETIGMALYMGGGPSMIYGAEALDAFDALGEGQ